MVAEVKKQLYTILDTNLDIPIVDYSYNKNSDVTYPFIRISINDIQRCYFKTASFATIIVFAIDIFSNYQGEEEVLEIEGKLNSLMAELYENPAIMYIEQSRCRILDDKTTGTTKKHAAILYRILCSGSETEQEDDSNNE